MVACNSIALRLGLQKPVIAHQIANMVYNMMFVPEDRFDLVAGLTPFALPTHWCEKHSFSILEGAKMSINARENYPPSNRMWKGPPNTR